jgi:hypothetical protein
LIAFNSRYAGRNDAEYTSFSGQQQHQSKQKIAVQVSTRALETLAAKRDVAAVFSPVGGCCSRDTRSYSPKAQLLHSVQMAGSGIDTIKGALKVDCNTRASGARGELA